MQKGCLTFKVPKREDEKIYVGKIKIFFLKNPKMPSHPVVALWSKSVRPRPNTLNFNK